MEADRFDDLTARLAQGVTRRRSLGLLGVLGVANMARADEVAARHHKKHKKKGKQPSPTCPARCPDCQACVNGQTCTRLADDTVCAGDGRCLAGICNPRPTCDSAFFACDPEDVGCCSGTCAVTPVPFCALGAAGTPCGGESDCLSLTCVGYRCQDR